MDSDSCLERLELICLMVRDLQESGIAHINAQEKRNGFAHYGEDLSQSNCKTAIERKIITLREQLNLLRKELEL